MTSEKQRPLDASRSRQVQFGCTPADRAAVLDHCASTSKTISEVLRETLRIAAGTSEPGEPREDGFVWLSARMTPEQIECLSAHALAAGLEPTVWLRLMVTAYVGADAARVLREQLARVTAASRGRRKRRAGP